MSEILSVQNLLNPILTLYAYHLRTDISQKITQKGEQISANADQLWEQLVELGQKLDSPALQGLKQDMVCYEEGEYNPQAENNWQSLLRPDKNGLRRKSIESKGDVNVELCPFRLHDTYAVDLTLSCNRTISPDKPISLDKLKQLNPEGLLLPENIKASIGQTLLLYGELTTPCNDSKILQQLANDCVAQLSNQILPQLIGQGKLFGNEIFEYDTLEIEPLKHCHILVWFKNHYTPTNAELGEVSEQLLYLLCAHHKILYAYNQAQYSFKEAKTPYSEIEQKVNDFSTIASEARQVRLEKFQDLLINLPKKALTYSTYLRDLADHQTTIATNTKNYKSRLKKLSELPDSKLPFLEEFIEFSQNKYESQIQVYRQHLEPGAKLLQQLIQTIRGMVAIDQTELEAEAQKREKELERVITLVGIGLAASSISASVMENPSQKLPLFSKYNIHNNVVFSFFVDVLFHLLVGMVFVIIMSRPIDWGIKKLLKRAG